MCWRDATSESRRACVSARGGARVAWGAAHSEFMAPGSPRNKGSRELRRTGIGADLCGCFVC